RLEAAKTRHAVVSGGRAFWRRSIAIPDLQLVKVVEAKLMNDQLEQTLRRNIQSTNYLRRIEFLHTQRFRTARIVIATISLAPERQLTCRWDQSFIRDI